MVVRTSTGLRSGSLPQETRRLPELLTLPNLRNRTMEKISIGTSGLNASRIGLGTWAIGGWMWGGTDEPQSIATIRSAIERGVTFIDTAPAYGFGRSEEIVGRALAEGGLRSKVVIA